ncbi:olfactomedin-4-like [Huso huso]|uniref:Olfactomedin-4-like n=1 Tax=Huso huso TaxID=61971 RepID=A0ABR0ZKL2_HUSHU
MKMRMKMMFFITCLVLLLNSRSYLAQTTTIRLPDNPGLHSMSHEPDTTPVLAANVTGSVDANGVCQCTVYLPDTTFPADRVEQLEIQASSLLISVEIEIQKILEYSSKIDIYESHLQNLTLRVEFMENSDISFTELDFELVKVEIQELEILISQLKGSLNGSNVIIEQLFVKIHNMSLTINNLEKLDKNNVLIIRREIIALRKQLKECEEARNQTKPTPTQPSIIYGHCDHGPLLNISEPFIVQLNWRGFAYKAGAWGRDPAPVPPKKDLYWQAPLRDGRYMDYYRQYGSFDDLLLYKNPKDYLLASNNLAQGSGMVVYNNYLYYNLMNSRQIRKVDIDTNGIVLTKELPGAALNNRFSYSGTPWQDIDLAVDESGLWAIYATEESTGNIVISKLNETTLSVEKTWVTRQYKPAASNAFIVCGVLYATKTITTRHEEIFYMYDTKTNQDTKISIPFKKVMEYLHGVNYNPPDHKLYVYNDGYLITYDLSFYPKNTNS